MKCLVTGINGVIGGNLSNLLVEKFGFVVWGCDREINNGYKHIAIDLMDRDSVLHLFSKDRFDCVIHCAADINHSERYSMFTNNIVSTINVVEASLASGVKKVFHTSGVPVIGKILQLPITEEHPTAPLTAYHLSKFHSEQLIEHYCKDKVDFINMRIPSPVGRNMPPRSIFPIFLDKIKRNETITLMGVPGHKQNYLDLRDLASFIYKASIADGVSGLFNVAARKSYSNSELAEAFIQRIGSKSKIVNNMAESSPGLHNWDVCTKKACERFGYVPEHSLDDTIDWVL